MKCIHCSKNLDEKATDFSLKVMLCKQCAVRVTRLRARIRSELEVLLAQLDDTMRFALTVQDLPGTGDSELSRRTLLQYITDMDERCRFQTQSSKSMKQSVSIADGSGSSSKLSAPASK